MGFWQAVLYHWVLLPALDNVAKIMILSYLILSKRICCFMYECGSFPHKKSTGTRTDDCIAIITEQPFRCMLI